MRDGEALGLLEENLNYQGKTPELSLKENSVMNNSQIWRLLFLPATQLARQPDEDLL
jgi:hypothetical protein